MNIDVAIVHAFTDRGTGGNPAAVVLDADALDTAQKLAIARELEFSETAFVSKSEVADFRLEFFTPNRQIAHCGHATIATFSYLLQQGRLTGTRSSKETIDGTRDIIIEGDTVFMEQRAPRYTNVPLEELHDEILPALGLDHLDAALPAPAYVNTGNAFLILPLPDRNTLATLNPDQEAINRISDRHDLIGFYPFTRNTLSAEFDAEARMFAPRYGIPEEAATGMAAGPLAAFLHDRASLLRRHLRISQGALMGAPSPSEIQVKLDIEGNTIRRLLAGGTATVMGTRSSEISVAKSKEGTT